ncbi:MAG: radical SAM protein [Ruminococcaceae bacterium]|nr:radical SAM protein [Oscillospiraceae bacterium]
MKSKTFHIPVFVPHKGCPHDCVFCNQRKITGQTEEMTPQKAQDIIEAHLATIEKYNPKGTYYTEIAFFGGSFTAIPIESMVSLLEVAAKYIKSGRVGGIRCSTRPDCISEEILDVCKAYGMTAIELGVQSTDEEVLLASNRGHSFEDVKKASELIKERGIELGLQMMTGLPGDTKEKSVFTARQIAALNPQCVRIYPTLVMEGTHLFEMYQRGKYLPQKLDDAVELAAELVEIFEEKNITILRIGLQTTDGVNSATVIGPYHNAFAELVYGRIIRKKIENHIVSRSIKNTTLEIDAPKDKISQIVGHKKENLMYFKEKYNINLKLNHKN